MLDGIAKFQRRPAVIAVDGFFALRFSVSHGSGRKEPGNLQNDRRNDEVLEGLSQKLPFRRMSGFATSTWAIVASASIRRY